MAIWQSFWPQFWYQTMIPKKEKKEELQSRMFPWLDDWQSKRLIETVDKLGITDTSEKLKKQQEIYKEVLPWIKAKEAQMNRQVIKNEQYNATLDTKDPKQKAVKMAWLKMEDLADMIKEKYDLDPNAPTDWIISEYNTMLNDMGIDEKLVEDYMNGKSDELLYVSWLKEDTRWWAENKSVLWVAENIVGWAYDSATGLPRFIAENLAKGVGWIAKKLWADEYKVQELVDSYIESLKDFSWEAMWADTESWLYKGTKMVWDIAQIANPAWLGKAGIKAGQVAAKVAKEWSLISKVAKWATIWAVDTAVFMPQSEQRMATGKELAIWAVAWWVLPIAWVWLNVAKKWFAKIAPKLELSWLLNPSKLNTVKEKLIQEWVDKADALDVGKWMLDRGIKWNKEQIVSQLDNLANQSKKAVDDTLWKSTTLFKNKTADDLLDKLAQEYDWSISQAGRDKFNKIQWLIQKSKKEWLTLTELNDVKRMVWDLDPYTATGKVKVSKSDLVWANSELKKFIEKSATETIEWVDENMIKMLNNETQIARWLSEWIARKESADAVREIVNFMAGRSPWAIVWGTVGYQQGWDWKSTIIWALAWWALGSTSMKTKAANMLYKAFNKQEQTVLQKFIQGWWAEKLSPKIINKLDKVMSDIKTLVLVWWKTQSPKKWNIIRVAPTKIPPKLPTKNESISRPVVRMKAPEELYHTSTKEIWNLTDDKVLWTTPDSKYTLKYGKEGSRNTYKINSEWLNILDWTSKKWIDIIESINKKLWDKWFPAWVLSDDGKVISFVLKDKNIIAELKKMWYDWLRTTESSLKWGVESVWIINPSKVKWLEATSKLLKPKK